MRVFFNFYSLFMESILFFLLKKGFIYVSIFIIYLFVKQTNLKKCYDFINIYKYADMHYFTAPLRKIIKEI